MAFSPLSLDASQPPPNPRTQQYDAPKYREGCRGWVGVVAKRKPHSRDKPLSHNTTEPPPGNFPLLSSFGQANHPTITLPPPAIHVRPAASMKWWLKIVAEPDHGFHHEERRHCCEIVCTGLMAMSFLHAAI